MGEWWGRAGSVGRAVDGPGERKGKLIGRWVDPQCVAVEERGRRVPENKGVAGLRLGKEDLILVALLAWVHKLIVGDVTRDFFGFP